MKVKLRDEFLVTTKGVKYPRGVVDIPDGIKLPTHSQVQDAEGNWIDASKYVTGAPLPGGGPMPEPPSTRLEVEEEAAESEDSDEAKEPADEDSETED